MRILRRQDRPKLEPRRNQLARQVDEVFDRLMEIANAIEARATQSEENDE